MVRIGRILAHLMAGGCLAALSGCATPKAASPPPPPAAAPAPAPRPSASVGSTAKPDEATLARYRAWIGWARLKHPYPESETRMFDVMMCESGGKSGIVNPAGPYTGLFQYSAPTWKGDWNAYRGESMLDPKSQIFATALAWSLKMQSHWGCYKKTR